MIEKPKNTSKPGTSKKISKKTLWIGGTVVLLLGGGIAVWMLMDKKKKQATQQRFTSIVTGGTTSSAPCSSRSYPLAMGTCHADVAVLQRHLKSLGADLGSTGANRDGVDQIFGRKTQAAAMQKLGKSSFNRSDIDNIRKA